MKRNENDTNCLTGDLIGKCGYIHDSWYLDIEIDYKSHSALMVMIDATMPFPLHGDGLNVVQQGWVVDPDSRMLTVKKQPVKTEQKLDSSKLHRLTEYVFHLEH
uniref:Uncharacterized protein n=1 Tax=Salix viminalis TaxID=40686 RepID=A0A6N2MPQ8_SALVM